MMKKMISWLGAVGALVSSAYAASATVWTEEGEGKMAPAYWYTFKYGTGASIDTSTTAANVKVGEMTATDSKTANGAGFGLTWKQNADYEDTPVSLSAYKGVCLTYKATAPFRIDFKQSTITDDNYYGAEMPATAGAKVFLAFADLTQGWKAKTAVAWNAGKQMGIQFSYKSNYVTAAQNSNTIQIVSLILDDECVTFAPEVIATATEVELNEGDTLALDMSKVFTDPDGDALTYTVKVIGDAKLADTLYNKTGVVNIITKENPKDAASVTITATDPNKKSATYAFDIVTVDTENAPVAVNDTYETKEETALKVTLKNNVLLNDYDPDGDTYTATLVTEPAHGTLSFDGESGIFTYTPEKDFFGVDVFTYILTEDARADQPDYEVKSSSDKATVTIKVTNVDDPIQVVVVDSTMTVEDTEYKLGDTLVLNEDFETAMVKIPLESLVFSDPDVDGTNLEIKVKTSGILTAEYGVIKTNHVVELSSVADANGVAKVSLFAVDGKDTASVSFYVKVTPVADPPVAKEDTYKVVQDSVNKIAAAKGLLANDKNPDGKSTLKAYLYDGAVEGKVTLAEDGSFTYEIGHFQGEDTFMYYVVNAEGDTSEPVVVTLNVEYKNLPPKVLAGVADTVGNRLAGLTEDFTTPKKFAKVELQSWFKDDSTASASLTFTARSDDSLLAPTVVPTGLSIASVKNACGEATVILIATDEQGASTELKIPASIACTNDKPVAAKVLDTVYIGTGAWADTLNLYNYVTDPDGDSLTFTITTNKVIETKFEWELDGFNLIVATKDSNYLDKGTSVTFGVKAADSLTYTSFNLVLLAKDAPKVSIKPTIAAAPKTNWQSAILANRGAVALFDMQGRVMWKAKLPVSEADVRNAAAQVQGRKILQVNKQTWTIK